MKAAESTLQLKANTSSRLGVSIGITDLAVRETADVGSNPLTKGEERDASVKEAHGPLAQGIAVPKRTSGG
jgi:hypothetical protein